MLVDEVEIGSALDAPGDSRPGRIRDWAWLPRYAKIWWILAASFWIARAASSRVDWLDWLKEPGPAGYLTVAFFPPLMLLLLGIERIRAYIENLPAADYEERVAAPTLERRKGPSGLSRDMDPLDPHSGVSWIGNPLNPLNAVRINRET